MYIRSYTCCYKCGSDLCLINEPVEEVSKVDLSSSHGQMKTNTS